MGKPKAPPPPDYAALAQQQGQESRSTAEYNSRLNRVNQIDPQGASLSWTTTPGPDGQPIWTQTTSYSPEQQKLYDSSMRIQQNLAGVGEDSLGRVGQAMSTPFDQAGLPALTGGMGAGQLTTQGPDASRYAQGNLNLGQFANSPNVNTQLDTAGVRALPGQANDQSRQRVEQALMSRLTPKFDTQESQLRNRLLNSGIEVGSDAYNQEMKNLGEQRNDAMMQAVLAGGQEESRQIGLNQGLQGQEFQQALAGGQFGQQGQSINAQNRQQALQSVLQAYGLNTQNLGQQYSQDMASRQFGNQAQTQGLNNQIAAGAFGNQARSQAIQEQAYLRQLPLNELNALRSGAQVANPQFSSYYTGGAAQAAPIMDAGIAQSNYNLQANQQAQSGQNALMGGLAQLGSAAIMFSDRRLKSDIVRVGTHKLGIGLYEYTIFGNRQRGVMADEVRTVMPEAVLPDESGFDRVNYSMLEA